MVFLQFQVHQILKDKQTVAHYGALMSSNFRKRYPRIYHMWEILLHVKQEFMVLFAFMLFFMIIIVTTKSIVNWGFQMILCLFIITYIGVRKQDKRDSGLRRLAKVWPLIIWYSSLVLILQITYQFAALPVVRRALRIDAFLDLLPIWIRRNLGILGFTVYSTFIWEKFIVYLLYFAIGVYVRKNMRESPIVTESKPAQGGDLNNSDMQQDYFQKEALADFEAEYRAVRFTTPYLIYKVKKIWFFFDIIS